VVALCEQESLLPFLPSHTLLLWLDAEGRREKGYSEAASPGTAELESPEGVAVTTDGEVLVVDADRRLVAVFGANGTLRKKIDLEAAWGRKPSYPSGIGMDADGGFIVEDLGAQIPYVRMYADGTVRNALELRYDDDRPTGRLYRVRGGPDGSLWGSSSSALLQLDDAGMVVRAIRDQPDPDELRGATAIALDADDGIYAADSTGAVHVFRSDGTLQQIDRPEPGDVPKALVSPSLAVASDGRVLLGQPGGSVLEFSSAGGRQARYPGDEPLRLWNPASGGFWARRAHEVALLDLKGRTVRTIAKKADRTWLGNVQSLVVAPDGPIAVCGFVRAFDPREHRWSLPDDKTTLSLYSADGTPTAAIEKLKVEGDCGLRPGSYDGRSIAIWDGWDIRIFDVTGKFVARFRPKPRGRDATGWPILLAAGGRELWLFDGVGLILDRYAMP
jgi:hypothetical protein